MAEMPDVIWANTLLDSPAAGYWTGRKHVDSDSQYLRADGETVKGLRELLTRAAKEMREAMECDSVACPGCQTNFTDTIVAIESALERKG